MCPDFQKFFKTCVFQPLTDDFWQTVDNFCLNSVYKLPWFWVFWSIWIPWQFRYKFTQITYQYSNETSLFVQYSFSYSINSSHLSKNNPRQFFFEFTRFHHVAGAFQLAFKQQAHTGIHPSFFYTQMTTWAGSPSQERLRSSKREYKWTFGSFAAVLKWLRMWEGYAWILKGVSRASITHFLHIHSIEGNSLESAGIEMPVSFCKQGSVPGKYWTNWAT